jgi:hypothetical protein
MNQSPGTSQPPATKDRWARFRGLRWWQLVLALIPLALLPIGGALGGVIGVVAMLANLSLARRPFPTGLKVAAMLGVVVLAYVAQFVIAGVINSATH